MVEMSVEKIRTRQSIAWELRDKLARDIALAQDWTDLQLRLAAQGYTFKAAGGGLALYQIKGNKRLCKAGALGPAYRQLALRFNAPFPGHPHAHLTTDMPNSIGAGPDAGADPDNLVLIEQL
jgi:hypothetical protein